MIRWLKRMVWGRKDLPELAAGEEIESPSRLLFKAFFSKKPAIVALVLLLSLFLFVFIAPAFLPMDVNYTDPLQQNVAPNYGMRSLPRALKEDVAEIDGFAGFTVGLSGAGEVFVWGNAKDRLSGVDMKELPSEVKDYGATHVAAGKDHILAVTKSGKLVGWGDKSCGQYGFESVLGALPTPEIFREGIAPESVSSLVCGYQTSALVLGTGEAYLWGNTNVVKNLAELSFLSGVKQVAFTNSAAVVLLENGEITTGTQRVFSSVTTANGEVNIPLNEYTVAQNAVQLAATNKCVAVLLQSGEVVVSGVFENGENQLPKLRAGEKFVSIDGGTRHFVGVTDLGNVYAWGHDAYGQCRLVQDGNTARAFAGALQTYAVDKEGRLVQSVGLKGSIMGTDGRGRDVFTRIVHGGKMTLTIGGVAVLVSSAIAILVGCAAGYFGGFADVLLMRITEIFSSIPFLPFAMLLSQIIKYYNIGETMRIFIIMLILGALSWTGLARMIRAQVLAEREKDYTQAARAMGVREIAIAFRHVLPNIVSVVLVSMTLDFAGCLLTESSLSYLGFGVQQPQPTWGNMLSGSNNSIVIQNYWWQWLFPALFLSLATICINVVGDALRDALDPKSSAKR
ncbi:MAG: ABC transporter permease subunit [Clostridia bacterium]|nr:ABC transporter permease subunit [Clostridia bacterium]